MDFSLTSVGVHFSLKEHNNHRQLSILILVDVSIRNIDLKKKKFGVKAIYTHEWDGWLTLFYQAYYSVVCVNAYYSVITKN